MMLNDFNHVVQAFSNQMDPRCKEKRELCENYIKAWHFGVDDLLTFIFDNKVIFTVRF